MSDDRMQWWLDARFGMFIHWGVYCIPARSVWAMYTERTPIEEYERLAQIFRPRRYSPDEWVALAREAGMSYMVLTARHHDGFSLFDSQVSDFTAPKRAAGRDLLAEFVEASRRAGMRLGFYYSLLDWRYPGYWTGPEGDPACWRELVDYVHTQVRELCTNYGKLDILWYDGAWPYTAKDWRSRELNAMVRSLQPDIIINDRSLLPEDFDTPEQHTTPSERAWESCMTLNDSWGYVANDHNWKSTRQLIHNLVGCASGGGNFLLNVGPRPDGTIPRPSVERLKEVGAWMSVHGESIYGTTRCPWLRRFAMFTTSEIWRFGFLTVKDSTVYLHVLRWPGSELCFTELKNRVLSARIVTTGELATTEQRGERLFLRDLPLHPPDPYDTVIALEVEGVPETVPMPR